MICELLKLRDCLTYSITAIEKSPFKGLSLTFLCLSLACRIMADEALAWRRLWRARGLCADRVLPYCYALPVLGPEELLGRAPKSVAVPGGDRQQLTEADRKLSVGVVEFVTGYVAEHLPAQVVATDLKPLLPNAASALAVMDVSGEKEYMGSFDLLLRLRATRPGTWRPYDNQLMALDMEMTGATSAVGVNSAYMRRIVEHGRAVMQAARKQRGCRVADCSIIAYLIRRPPGPTFQGRAHAGSWSFVAFEVDSLLAWSPTSQRAPNRIVTLGSLLVEGKGEEPDSLPRPPPAPIRPPRDRWHILRTTHGHRGWCQVQDFVDVFGLQGRADPKHATYKACKRLREQGHQVKDKDLPGVRGRPKKCARICDLQQVYVNLQ